MSNVLFRTQRTPQKRNRAFKVLADEDIRVSPKANALVTASTEGLNNTSLQEGIDALTLHISTLSTKAAYLLIYAGLLSTAIRVLKRCDRMDAAVVLIAVAAPLLARERTLLSGRAKVLEERLHLLEQVKTQRKERPNERLPFTHEL